jgi:putative membrane protein
MALLTGLMLGSLRIPFYKITATYTNIWTTTISAIIGFTIVFILEKKFTN